MPSHASPEVHLYLDTPDAIFRARVNMPGTITYPIVELTFDGVTLGAFGDVSEDMTVLLGTTEGGDDLGRTRVKGTPTSSALGIGRASQGVEDGTVTVQDNAYITVLNDFRIWAKLPFQDANGVDYKDSTVTVGDYTTEIPPVSNCGPPTAGTIDTGTGKLRVAFDGTGSYAMATGATIASYAWDLDGATVVSGDLDEDEVTADFDPGRHWIALTVVDSNGKAHTARTVVVAVDPDDDITIQAFAVESHRLTQQGSSIRFRIFADLPRSIVPDGAFGLFWWDEPSGPSDRSHIKFFGWEQTSDAGLRAQEQGLVRETTLEFVDVAGRLDSLPGFPQALQREDDPLVDEQWSLMPDLTISKALHYLLFWHSTALGLADFYLPTDGDDYPSMRLDSTGATLYDQANSRALSMVPDHILTCNSMGELRVLQDWMLVDTGDRPAAAPILTEDDYGELSFGYARPPRVHVLRASAIVASTDWIVLGGEETLPLAFSIAPGEAFSQGTNEQVEAEGLTQSQEQLNVSTGHKYARLNARFGPVRVRLLDLGDLWDYEPALLNRVQLNIAAQYAAQRGLPFTQVNAMVKDLTIRYNSSRQGLAIDAQATLELETSGVAAVTHVPEVEGNQDDYETPPPPPPSEPPPGLVAGVEQVAGIGLDGHVYRTFDFQTPSGSGGPTWDDVDLSIAEAIYTWVVDPFSPGYVEAGQTEINGWIATETDIYRVEDIFGTPTPTAVLTFDEVADAASFHWRSIQASFGAYFAPGANPWLICVSYYGDTPGHEGTWATYSTDAGATWAEEVQLSADYSTGDTRFNPIGVYASPKTPGLGYTVARGEASTDGAPHWVYFDDAGVPTDQGAAITKHFEELVTDVAGGGATSQVTYLMISPPLNTARVLFHGAWSTTRVSSGLGSASAAIDIRSVPSTVDVTENLTVTITSGAGNSGSTSGSFTCEALLDSPFASNTWPGTINQIGTGSGDDESEFGVGISFNISVNDTGGASDSLQVTFDIVIDEIELEDGTIYTFGSEPSVVKKTVNWGATWATDTTFDPGSAMAGTIHFPWPDNAGESVLYHGYFDATGGVREFKLFRVEGGVATDISPNDGSIDYGVNRGHFGVRTHDSDRDYVLAAVVGNGTSGDADDDLHALYVSADRGDTWSEVVAPFADSLAPTGRPALEAAFGGDSEQVIFIWGPPGYISYSDDLGATVDDRSGNLAGGVAFVGIAGGPSA